MDVSQNVRQLLGDAVASLSPASPTRQAVERGADIAEISETATEEGLKELASALFIAQQMELPGQTVSVHDELRETAYELLRESRGHLPASSRVAAAIDRDAPLEEIASTAEEEGATGLASALFEIIQLRWQSGRD
jgi:hypothetical protein